MAIIKRKNISSPTTKLSKDKASKTSKVVQDEHLKEFKKRSHIKYLIAFQTKRLASVDGKWYY